MGVYPKIHIEKTKNITNFAYDVDIDAFAKVEVLLDYEIEKLDNIEYWNREDWIEAFFYISGEKTLRERALGGDLSAYESLVRKTKEVLLPLSEFEELKMGALNEELLGLVKDWLRANAGSVKEMDEARVLAKYLKFMEAYNLERQAVQKEIIGKHNFASRGGMALKNLLLENARPKSTRQSGLNILGRIDALEEEQERKNLLTEYEAIDEEYNKVFSSELSRRIMSPDNALNSIIESYTLYRGLSAKDVIEDPFYASHDIYDIQESIALEHNLYLSDLKTEVERQYENFKRSEAFQREEHEKQKKYYQELISSAEAFAKKYSQVFSIEVQAEDIRSNAAKDYRMFLSVGQAEELLEDPSDILQVKLNAIVRHKQLIFEQNPLDNRAKEDLEEAEALQQEEGEKWKGRIQRQIDWKENIIKTGMIPGYTDWRLHSTTEVPSRPASENYILLLKEEVKNLKAKLGGFFPEKPSMTQGPDQAEEILEVHYTQFLQETPPSILEFIPEGLDARERFNLAFHFWWAEYTELQHEKDRNEREEARYRDLAKKLKAVAPIALLNQNILGNTRDHPAAIYGKSVLRSFNDRISIYLRYDQEDMANLQEILNVAEVSSRDLRPGYGEKISNRAKEWEKWSIEWITMHGGTLTGELIQTYVGGGVAGTLLKGSKYYRWAKRASNYGKKIGPRRLGSSIIGGTGQLTSSLIFKGEANFTGFLGGAVGGGVSFRLEKAFSTFIKNPKFAKIIEVVRRNKKIKTGLEASKDFLIDSVVEIPEEYAESLAQTLIESKDWKEFKTSIEDQFGTLNKNQEFILSTFVMAGLGNAVVEGSSKLKVSFSKREREANDRLSKLPLTERNQIHQILAKRDDTYGIQIFNVHEVGSNDLSLIFSPGHQSKTDFISLLGSSRLREYIHNLHNFEIRFTNPQSTPQKDLTLLFSSDSDVNKAMADFDSFLKESARQKDSELDGNNQLLIPESKLNNESTWDGSGKEDDNVQEIFTKKSEETNVSDSDLKLNKPRSIEDILSRARTTKERIDQLRKDLNANLSMKNQMQNAGEKDLDNLLQGWKRLIKSQTLRVIPDYMRYAKSLPIDWKLVAVGDTVEVYTKSGRYLATLSEEKITAPGGEKRSWNSLLNRQLMPNQFYDVDGYGFVTDSFGRVTQVIGELKWEVRDRLTSQQSGSVRLKGGIIGQDQGGHIIAARFFGPGEQINYWPQDANLNLSAWKKLENDWNEALREGIGVKVEIKTIFEGNSGRPKRFEVDYIAGDKKVLATFFENGAAEIQDNGILEKFTP